MFKPVRPIIAVALAAASVSAAPAVHAEAPSAPQSATADCVGGSCSYQLTPRQLLTVAERLVGEKKYNDARPLVDAMAQAPGMELPYNFLSGMIAVETGDPETAVVRFRKILEDDPGQTRVRLELARALIMTGDRGAADYHLKLAQNDADIPEEVARTIRNARSILRSQRNWKFGFDIGIAPDTNINNATSAETIDVNFGPIKLPLNLDDSARARSGIGQTASVYGSLRIPAGNRVALVFDTDAHAVNYKGKDADDYAVQLAAGPEWQLSRNTAISLQAVGQYRWYGGRLATRQFGSKLTLQTALGRGERLGLQLDARRTESGFNQGYTGWQIAGNTTFEKVVGKSMIASASLFARRDFLDLDAYSNTSAGFTAGIGGELPLGINAGISVGASHARFDEPLFFYSNDPRRDWRYNGRAYAGLRKIRLFGFSPSIEYSYARIDSNYEIYRSDRHRVQFKLARYF